LHFRYWFENLYGLIISVKLHIFNKETYLLLSSDGKKDDLNKFHFEGEVPIFVIRFFAIIYSMSNFSCSFATL